jgi:uncharacterized OsmC-like protein
MYEANITGHGKHAYHASAANLRFDMGAEGKAASPVHVLLASLCGCIGHYVEIFLEQSRVGFESFDVGATCEPPTEASDLGLIDLVIRVRGADLSEPTRAELCKFVTRCRVYGSLGSDARVKISVAR